MVGGLEYALLYGGCCAFVLFAGGTAAVLYGIGKRAERKRAEEKARRGS
jgi:hypothetical protein